MGRRKKQQEQQKPRWQAAAPSRRGDKSKTPSCKGSCPPGHRNVCRGASPYAKTQRGQAGAVSHTQCAGCWFSVGLGRGGSSVCAYRVGSVFLLGGGRAACIPSWAGDWASRAHPRPAVSAGLCVCTWTCVAHTPPARGLPRAVRALLPLPVPYRGGVRVAGPGGKGGSEGSGVSSRAPAGSGSAPPASSPPRTAADTGGRRQPAARMQPGITAGRGQRGLGFSRPPAPLPSRSPRSARRPQQLAAPLARRLRVSGG